MNRGIYNLIILQRCGRKIRIGRLGEFYFPKGYYIYTGSALNNLCKRIERHKRKNKKIKWHIDYLLKFGKIIKVKTYNGKKKECKMSNRISKMNGAKIVVPKFGSSDCRCKTHLYYFKKELEI